jgi:8-amino-3,8-dideoxy-alpha-D-manno-octulosonate transaminase
MYPGGNRIGPEEEEAVLAVLRSKRLFRYYGATDGPSEVEAFEGNLAELIGSRHAVAVASGTTALTTALAAASVGPGDQVIVPSYTWVSTAAAVVAVGAVPILAEVDDSLTIDVQDAETLINGRTRAIIPVHMRGAAADMAAVNKLAQEHDLVVIEDAAQAMGGRFGDQRLGSIGHIGCFSLQYNKIITCGEGGVVVTDDHDLHARALM